LEQYRRDWNNMHGTTMKRTTSFKITVTLKASVKLDILALYKLPLDKIHFSRRSTTVHNLKVSWLRVATVAPTSSVCASVKLVPQIALHKKIRAQ